MKIKNSTILFFLSFFLICSCGEKSEPEEKGYASEHTLYVNGFIKNVMDYYYLWESKMPYLDITRETDSKKYFEKLLYSEDRYSFISDDAEGLLNSLNGVERTYGYSLTLTWADQNRTHIYAIVDYVYPNSPAAKAGIGRGDLIQSINGGRITEKNINDLINTSSIALTFIDYSNGDGIGSKNAALTSVTMELNPILSSRIIERTGKKIGYLAYLSYISNYDNKVNEEFQKFKEAGVTELILDLRYNSGGKDISTINLCSNLAPSAAVTNREIAFVDYYNTTLTNAFKEDNIDPNSYFDATHMASNLDLKRIYILTSVQTASASEATILVLKPYMEVITIGETTYGKNTSMAAIQPKISETALDPKIKNWILLPVVAEFKNKNGESSKGGISPTHEVPIRFPYIELTSNSEPLIAKALSLISGAKSTTVKSAGERLDVHMHLTSKYDKLKSNQFITIK